MSEGVPDVMDEGAADGTRAERRGVLGGMLTGFVVTLACVALVLIAAPRGWTPIEVRARTLAAAFAILAAWVAAGVGDVARRRFASPQAIGGGEADAAVANANAVLRNTVEQAVLAALVYAALVVTMPGAQTLLAVLVALFSIGRVMFWMGHAARARDRALGFALTFYPSVAGLVVLFARLVGA